MEYLKQVLHRLAEISKRMSPSQAVILVAIVVGGIVGIVTVASWVGRVAYQPLYTNLEATEAAEVVQYLADNNIPYQLNNNGTTIEVPEAKLYQTRLSLASQGLPHSGTVGYSIFDQTNIGMTDFLQKLNYRRALEGELGRTISSLSEVQAARVHIVIPEERLFSDQQKEATASVVLKLRRSSGLSKAQVTGISHLIASSVEGLKPNNITIMDYEGNLLSSSAGGDAVSALTSTQMEMTQAAERDLERKAQTMLDGVLGPGKAIVRITAELNFQQYSRTSENYDPNMVAVRSEQRTENTDVASKKKKETDEDRQDNRSEITVTNYEISKSVESIVNPMGTVKRLSVAVLLDGTYKRVKGADGKEELTYSPRPQEEIDRLSSIVKNAVGYSSERNDQVQIVNIAFDKNYLTDEQKQMDDQYNREFYYNIGKKIVIVLVVLLGILYLRKLLKKFFAGLAQILPGGTAGSMRMQQSTEYEPEIPQIEEVAPLVVEKRKPKLVDQMQKVAKEEPEEIARVIRTMMVE